MFQAAASSSGRNGQFAFGDYWAVNGAVRANAHFLCADQAASDGDSVAKNKILCAFYAAVNSRTRTNAQISADYDVSANGFSGMNLKVAVMEETLRWRRVCACGHER